MFWKHGNYQNASLYKIWEKQVAQSNYQVKARLNNLDPEDVLRAQKLAGSLIWLSTRTRPDICYAQSRVSSMATKAPKTALMEGIRVLKYLQGTKDVGLHFGPCQGGDEVIAYTDANFSANRSQTGSVIKFGSNAIAWRSMKQSVVSPSSAESEVQHWPIPRS